MRKEHHECEEPPRSTFRSMKQPVREERGLAIGTACTHPQRGRRKVVGHGSYSMDYQYYGTSCGTAFVDTDVDDAGDQSECFLSIYVSG